MEIGSTGVLAANATARRGASSRTDRFEGDFYVHPELFDVEFVEAAKAPALAAYGTDEPLCNYPGLGFLSLSWTEWCNLSRDCKGSWLEIPEASEHRAAHRVRVAVVNGVSMAPVFVVDALRIDPPVLAG